MLSLKFIKFLPSEYVLKYRNGEIVKEGKGLSFFYYEPNTSVVVIPTSSSDIPYMFEEITNDYQKVSVQGQVTYRIENYKRISEILDYTYDMKKNIYVKDDYRKIPQRLINIIKVIAKNSIQNMALTDAIKSSEILAKKIREELKTNQEISSLGIEIMGFSVLGITPNKETSRALEAQAREEILKKADEAIYERRNSSIEQERRIKENELSTEIAIEQKKKQIQEAQLESKRFKMKKEHDIKDEELGYQTKLEEKRKEFINLSVENSKAQSDSKLYEFAAMMKVLNEMNPEVLQSLATIGMDTDKLIAESFKQLANNAGKIGELNISPDLLKNLVNRVNKK